ncbi:MAG: RagB/SusD family nutrient uptake outer membrane protein [Bacteroidaceae bacterium]|nr:RagB/SusD family nutrient uptake outer membrane protein [Bacteroidaceae bacterium]
MKNIVTLLLLVSALAFSSCDLELKPYNAIPEDEALQTPQDFANMRVGLYSPLKGMNGGGYYSAMDIQCDNFNAVEGFSNNYGDFYRWQFNSSNSTVEAIYGNYYGLIARANYILYWADKINYRENENFTEEDVEAVDIILGECYFIRAYCHFGLAQYFCDDYEAATADAPNSGVALVTKYEKPTSDNTKYIGRSTLNETFDQIEKDLDMASLYITNEGTVGDAYINAATIDAFSARVALARDDYETAAELATALINSGTYALCGKKADLDKMWTDDSSSEIIWMLPILSADELGPATGEPYLPQKDGGIVDYIPTKSLLELFNTLKDTRINVYFKAYTLATTTSHSGKIRLFNKYPEQTDVWKRLGGNESYRWITQPKVFRIAEMYLIAAEAYAQMDKLESGSYYLMALESKRITGQSASKVFSTRTELMDELKLERRREMCLEGTRLFDLKRWHLGVNRGATQQDNLCDRPGSTTTTALKKAYDDYHMTWPIPQSEINANPQMVQNKGY